MIEHHESYPQKLSLVKARGVRAKRFFRVTVI
jgi:hypothetical protein